MTVMLLAVATVLTEGAFGVYSPDGKRIAYQAETNGLVQVAVKDLVTGAVTWGSEGPGEGLYPAWGRDGAVIYTYGHETGTAYEHRKNGKTGGYNLYRWKDGRRGRLTAGRCRDMLASVAPDGSVYFTSTRGLESPSRSQMGRDRLFRRVKGGAITEVRALNLSNSGVHSASVSPDGKNLLWAEVSHLRGTWRICAAPLGRAASTRPCVLTSADACSYAPRWHPDCRHVCYTACKAGDSGWCVYVQELATGAETRVCEGRHPCFSPDGKKILFDRDGRLYEQPFVPSVFSPVAPRPPETGIAYYRFRLCIRPGVSYVDSRSVVSDTHRLFGVSLPGDEKDRLVFHLKNGRPMFQSLDLLGNVANLAMGESCPQGTNFVFTCVRTDRSLEIYRDGRLMAARTYPAELVSLAGAEAPKIRSTEEVRVTDFSSGAGRPNDLEKPVTRADLTGGPK